MLSIYCLLVVWSNYGNVKKFKYRQNPIYNQKQKKRNGRLVKRDKQIFVKFMLFIFVFIILCQIDANKTSI